MARTIDNIIAMRILLLLTTPFERSDAYRLGIIDKTGKELKKMSELHTSEELSAYTVLHRLVFRLKRIINKVPVENKQFISFAAAWALIREHMENENAIDETDDILEELFYMAHEDPEAIKLAEELEDRPLSFKQFMEEMGVAGGGIAGIGISNPNIPNQAEPGISKKSQKKWREKNKIIRRK